MVLARTVVLRCVRSAGVGQHQRHVVVIPLVNHGHGAKVPLALRALVIEQVIAEGTAPQELAAAGDFEPLGGCFAGLELRHLSRRGHKREHYDVTVRSTKSLLPLLLVALPLGLVAGCRAAVPVELQWPVAQPPPLQASDPRLWVALGTRLGAGDAPQPLILRSASGQISLRDSTGQRWHAPQLILRWQRSPLSQPLEIARLVVGPFASFETAERQAQIWRRLGVPVTLAQPGDWELWAPPGSPLPPGWSARELRQQHRERVQPLLVQPARPPLALVGPVQIEAPGGLRWQGGVYGGPFRLQPDATGSWSLVEQVPLERYLEGVVPHEIGADAPAEALAAQTVLARTWALRNLHRYGADGYHLCATVQCQVYSDPRQAGSAVRQAIQRTRSQLLSWQGQPIHAVYHGSNGGVAAGLQEAWDAEPLPYLNSGLDRADAPLTAGSVPSVAAVLASQQSLLGRQHPLFRWSRLLDRDQLSQALARRGLSVGAVQRLTVLERGPSGRVLTLAVEGSQGRTTLRLDAIRRTLRQLPSTLFELSSVGPGAWRVVGGGFGHGVGLSQAGAIDLGQRGWSYARILERYYPGTRLERLQQLPPTPPGHDP